MLGAFKFLVQIAPTAASALILSIASLFPLFYLPWSLWHGEEAGKIHGTRPDWNGPRHRRREIILRGPHAEAEPYAYHEIGDTAALHHREPLRKQDPQS